LKFSTHIEPDHEHSEMGIGIHNSYGYILGRY
jgi:hypothetical protein